MDPGARAGSTRGSDRRQPASIIDNPTRRILFADENRLSRAGWGANRMNRRQFGRVVAGTAATLRFSPSFAQLVDKAADQLTNGEFNWNPDRSESGPVILIVSLPDQRV